MTSFDLMVTATVLPSGITSWPTVMMSGLPSSLVS